MSLLFVIACLVAFVLAGIPIPFSLGATAIIYFVVFSPVPIGTLGQVITGALTDYALLAVALFLFCGRLAEEMQGRDRLVALVRSIAGQGRMSAAASEVLASLLIPDAASEALLNRSEAATAAVNRLRISGTLGFPATAQAGLLAFLRTIMPPSTLGLVLAISFQQSMVQAWIALASIALLCGAASIALAAASPGGESAAPQPQQNRRGAALWLVFSPLALFLLVAGIATPTEAGALSLLLLLIGFVAGGFPWRQFLKAGSTALQDIGMIYLTVAFAATLGMALHLEGAINELDAVLQNAIPASGVYLVFVAAMVGMLSSAVGPLATILLVGPALYPTATALGIHVHAFTVVVGAAAGLGTLAPPFGTVFVSLSAGSPLPSGHVASAMMLVLLIGALLLFLGPAIAQALVNILFDL